MNPNLNFKSNKFNPEATRVDEIAHLSNGRQNGSLQSSKLSKRHGTNFSICVTHYLQNQQNIKIWFIQKFLDKKS